MTRAERVGLTLVLLVYLGLACAYAWLTPPWNNPDEPAHYNYVAFVAERQALPELVVGDWDQGLLSEAIPERFHPRFDVSSIRYESHQPPLYYLLSAPIYSATSSTSLRFRVFALRAISIVLGLALGIAAFSIARAVAPGDPRAGPLAAAIALLIPMSTATAASVNNDMLSMVLAALATLILIRWISGLRDGPPNAPGVRSAGVLGLLVGLLLLTKLTVYIFAVMLVGTAIAVGISQKGAAARSAYARGTALALLVAAIVSGWWFLRSAGVYGWDDLLAQRRHDAVVVGQPRYADFGPANWQYLMVTAFHSFFAQFGWMTIVVDNLTYAIYGVFVVFALVGARIHGSERPGVALAVLLVVAGVVLGQLLYYNMSFIQAQGRYLFPAMGAIAAMISAGWLGLGRRRWGAGVVLLWASLALATAVGGIGNWDIGPASVAVFVTVLALSLFLHRRFGQTERTFWYLTAATVIGLGALNLMCLTRYIVPFYRG